MKQTYLEAMFLEHGLDEYERGEVGDGGDDLRHVLLRHLHQPAVLLLRGQRVLTGIRYPLVFLDKQITRINHAGRLIEMPYGLEPISYVMFCTFFYLI